MRYLVTIGVPDVDIPHVLTSIDIIASCLTRLGYHRALPQLSSVTPDHDIRKILSRWARTLQPDDLVLLYFAGHGITLHDRHYLGLPGTNWDYPDAEALPTEELFRVLAGGTALSNLLIILDTCYSGQAAWDAQSIAKTLQGSRLERTFWLIAASQPRQMASDGAFAIAFEKLIRTGLGATVARFEIATLVEDLRPSLPGYQSAAWSTIGLAQGKAPDFFPNPNFISESLAGHPVEDRSWFRTDLAQHWKPRAMGSEAIFQGGRWYFTGRTEALRRIIGWLRQPDSAGKACIVTGNPGSGKSAVLGYLVTASDAEERRAPSLENFLKTMPSDTRPDAGCITFAFHLKGRTLAETQTALGHHFETKPEEVLSRVAQCNTKTVLVFDALDEAMEPSAIGESLLRPLTGYAHVWLVVGTRRPELQHLGQKITRLDLDAPEFRKDEDVARYVNRLLLAEDETRLTPYRDNFTAAQNVANAVAREANGNFLVARFIARSLIERDTAIDLLHEAIPKDVAQAFGAYLKTLGERSGLGDRQLRDLLRPLAYAQGQGLPRAVWALLAKSDIEPVLELASAFIAEYAEDGRTVYRLYHEALAESLRDPQRDAERHLEISQTLIKACPERDWLRADRYTRKYLSIHAAYGDPSLLGELVLDPRFLIAADPARLLSVSGRLSAGEPRRRLDWFGLASDRLPNTDFRDRASYLELVGEQNGARDLSEAAKALGVAERWQPRWARWGTITPHRVLKAHEGGVNAVALRDGIVVSGSYDHTVRLWDAHSGQPLGQPLRGHERGVTAVALRDGIVVSGSYDATVRLWDAHSGQPLGQPLRGHEYWVRAVALRDGIVVSGSDDATVRLWDAHSGQPLGQPLRGHEGGVRAVALRDGIVVSGSDDATVRLWDAHSGQPLGQPLRGHERGVNAVALRDGIVVSGSDDATVRLWDAHSGQPLGQPLRGHERGVNAVALRDGIVVSGSDDATVRLWDAHSGQPLGQPLRGHERGVTAVALRDGIVVSGSYDHTVRLWDAHSGQPLGQPLRGHEGGVRAVALRDGIVVSGSDDATVRLWDAHSGQPLGQPLLGHERGVNAVALRDGIVVSGSDDATVRLWDAHSGQPLGQPLRGHERGVNAVALRDGIVVSGSYDQTVRLWDAYSGQPLGQPLRGHEGPVNAVALRDGIVVSGSYDQTVRLWDAHSGQPLGQPLLGHERGVYAVALRDGIVVSGSYDQTVRLWDAHSGQPLGQPLRGHERGVNAVALRDGIVVSGSEDQTVRLWDAHSGQIKLLIHLGSPVYGLAFAPDGVCAACNSGLVYLEIDL